MDRVARSILRRRSARHVARDLSQSPLFAERGAAMMIDRRTFLRSSLGAAALLQWAPSARARENDDPHFFLEVIVSGGWDPTYLFDARPRAMTAAGLQHSTIAVEPEPWIGANGGR